MKIFQVLLFLCLSTAVIGQSVVEVSDIVCTDPIPDVSDGEISFTLNWTEDGVPVATTDSGFNFFDQDDNNILGAGNNGEATDFLYSGTLQSHEPFTCSDILNQDITIRDNDNPNEAIYEATFRFIDANAIPTMGQWALMILGLLLTTVALVTIKKRNTSQI